MDWSHKTSELPCRQPTPDLGLPYLGTALFPRLLFPFNWSILCTVWGHLSKACEDSPDGKGWGAIWAYKYPLPSWTGPHVAAM